MSKPHTVHKPHPKPAPKTYKRNGIKDIKVSTSVSKPPEPEPKQEPKPQPKPAPKIEPPPKTQPKAYTMEDWQKEVAEHVTPGHPIPDWLIAKAPK